MSTTTKGAKYNPKKDKLLGKKEMMPKDTPVHDVDNPTKHMEKQISASEGKPATVLATRHKGPKGDVVTPPHSHGSEDAGLADSESSQTKLRKDYTKKAVLERVMEEIGDSEISIDKDGLLKSIGGEIPNFENEDEAVSFLSDAILKYYGGGSNPHVDEDEEETLPKYGRRHNEDAEYDRADEEDMDAEKSIGADDVFDAIMSKLDYPEFTRDEFEVAYKSVKDVLKKHLNPKEEKMDEDVQGTSKPEKLDDKAADKAKNERAKKVDAKKGKKDTKKAIDVHSPEDEAAADLEYDRRRDDEITDNARTPDARNTDTSVQGTLFKSFQDADAWRNPDPTVYFVRPTTHQEKRDLGKRNSYVVDVKPPKAETGAYGNRVVRKGSWDRRDDTGPMTSEQKKKYAEGEASYQKMMGKAKADYNKKNPDAPKMSSDEAEKEAGDTKKSDVFTDKVSSREDKYLAYLAKRDKEKAEAKPKEEKKEEKKEVATFKASMKSVLMEALDEIISNPDFSDAVLKAEKRRGKDWANPVTRAQTKQLASGGSVSRYTGEPEYSGPPKRTGDKGKDDKNEQARYDQDMRNKADHSLEIRDRNAKAQEYLDRKQKGN